MTEQHAFKSTERIGVSDARRKTIPKSGVRTLKRKLVSGSSTGGNCENCIGSMQVIARRNVRAKITGKKRKDSGSDYGKEEIVGEIHSSVIRGQPAQ